MKSTEDKMFKSLKSRATSQLHKQDYQLLLLLTSLTFIMRLQKLL